MADYPLGGKGHLGPSFEKYWNWFITNYIFYIIVEILGRKNFALDLVKLKCANCFFFFTGHPNIKAFVTQGGLQSMEEAISNGVPLIGMPFFGDQPLNVAKMVKLGIAQTVDTEKVTSDLLKEAIIEVAENPK